MVAEPLTLEPKKCVLILNDMINRLFKGQGPPYATPPHRQAMLDNVIKLVAHCRSVDAHQCPVASNLYVLVYII